MGRLKVLKGQLLPPRYTPTLSISRVRPIGAAANSAALAPATRSGRRTRARIGRFDRSSSSPAKAGEGDHAKHGGGGVGLDAAQSLPVSAHVGVLFVCSRGNKTGGVRYLTHSLSSSAQADDPVLTALAAFTGWSAFADHDRSRIIAVSMRPA